MHKLKVNQIISKISQKMAPDFERKLKEQARDVANFDRDITAANNVRTWLEGQIENIIRKIGNSIPEFGYREVEKENELSDPERETLIEELHKYASCRDVVKEKHLYWVERYWTRKRFVGDDWYFYINPDTPIWLIITRILIKSLFYVSVFSASLMYLHNNSELIFQWLS